ncbi:von Willebrand factor A domain-containing protein 5A-like [Pelodytes ibericus]
MVLCSGLITSANIPVPLRGISVDVQVKGFVADVSATLKYKNVEENAVEAVFVFPMDDDSAVYSFQATIEGKTIVADIQEKEQSHKTYDEAISQGQQAFLLEEDQSSGDIFSCSVGNLLPGQEAEVTLLYVQELAVEADGAVRFVLPAVLNPRYNPEGQKESITEAAPEGLVGEIPYTLSLNARFQSVHGIAKIESSSQISPLEYTNEEKTEAKVSLAEGHKFEQDVEILVYYTDASKPSVSVEVGDSDFAVGSLLGDPVVMLNFYPSFPAVQEMASCGEFIFLVDRSGSMTTAMTPEPNSPTRIQSTKETLVLLLKSLPVGCYFNVFGFGTSIESFFSESVAYSQETVNEAVRKVNEMSADLEGTEILQALQKIYKTAARSEHPRQLFVFTDGEVSNTRRVISEVRRNSSNHRCFAFGIGEGASTALLKGISRSANGTCQFITGNERLQSKALQSLKYALQPVAKEVELKWTLPDGLDVVLISQAPAAIFHGQRSIVYAQLQGQVGDVTEGLVSLNYKFQEEVFINELQLTLNPEPAERPTIHRLAAKVLISELEADSDSGKTKKRIVETSIQSGVISSLTTYIAINKETMQTIEGPPTRRNIPPTAPEVAVCTIYAPTTESEETSDQTESKTESEETSDQTEAKTESEETSDQTEAKTELEETSDQTEANTESEETSDQTEAKTESEETSDQTEAKTESEETSDQTEAKTESEETSDQTEAKTESEETSDQTEAKTESEETSDQTEAKTESEETSDQTEAKTESEETSDQTETKTESEETSDQTEAKTESEETSDQTEAKTESEETSDQTEAKTESEETSDQTETKTESEETSDQTEAKTESEETSDQTESVERSGQDEPVLSSEPSPTTQADVPILLRLVTVQNADGSWDQSSELASILGISEEFKENRPELEVEAAVWTTLLAVLWLHTSRHEQRDEWELVEWKAVLWLKSKAGSSFSELLKAGNELLKSSVDAAVFGF